MVTKYEAWLFIFPSTNLCCTHSLNAPLTLAEEIVG